LWSDKKEETVFSAPILKKKRVTFKTSRHKLVVKKSYVIKTKTSLLLPPKNCAMENENLPKNTPGLNFWML